ncbi:MAG: hypothetical protein JXR37_04050 [Kiritimatiellae bacterium]|nr:hypothetical protein [Kiritimatiellia bacterium]
MHRPTKRLFRFLAGVAAGMLLGLGAAAPGAPVNLLPNSSFEDSPDARELYPIVGEYRHLAADEWMIDAAQCRHGRQSLRMAGTAPFFWQVLNLDAREMVFSVHMKASRENVKVELGYETLSFIDDGAVYARKPQRQVVSVGPEWTRYEVRAAGGAAKLKFMPLHLHRAWVRPLVKDVVWVDAAQLEAGSAATAYQPARGGNGLPSGLDKDREKALIYGPDELVIRKPKSRKAGEIPLVVRESAGTARQQEPVWGGVPFPPGVLFEADAVRLYDAAGNEVPCQTRALARRHIDGSVTSLLVDFQASVPAGGAARYVLRYGPDPQAPAGVALAAEDEHTIRLDSGPVQAALRKDAFCWFDSLRAGARTLAPPPEGAGCFAAAVGGVTFGSNTGKPRELRVESNGPLHAVILARGSHRAADGSATFLDYEARIHVFKGKSWFLLESAFENREPGLNTEVGAIFVRLPAAGHGAVPCAFGTESSGELEYTVAPGGSVLFTQLHAYYGAGRYDLAVDRGAYTPFTKVLRDTRATGRVRVGDTALAVHDFAPLNPKAVELRPQSVTLYHWPARHVRFLDLPFGTAGSLRFAYAPFGGEDDGCAAAQTPLLLQPDKEWVAASGVFERYLTAEQAAAAYPRFHKRLQPLFDVLADDREMLDLTGMFDYGEIGVPMKWMNNETTALRNLFMHYLRTDDPRLFRRAWTLARHLREVDICHARPGTRLMHHPSGGIHTTYGWHTGHYWITGLIWHYLLTGDPRTYEIVKDSGALLMKKYRNDHYVGRERTRMLLHLAQLYDLTHLKCFREAFETHYNFGKPTLSSDYYGGTGLLLLEKWHEVTGDERCLARLREDAAAFLKKRTTDPVPGAGIGQGRGWYLFSALPVCWEATGDRRFIDGFHDRLVWHTVSTHGVDHNAVRGTEYLWAAARLGTPEHEMMPENLLGIDILTGSMSLPRPPRGEPRFRIRLVDRRDEPFVVGIYRTRNFRAEQRKTADDGLAYRVVRPDGSTLAKENLSGKACAWRRIRVAPDGVCGDYTVELDCLRDGQGAFSCSLPGTFLDARRMFGFRRDRCATGFARFAFRAPLNAPGITLRLRWPAQPGSEGQGTAVRIQDPTGRVVGERRWIAPMGTVYAESGEQIGTIDRMEFPIPAPNRGKPLVITILAAKWLGWQIEGLEEPWLAASPAAFGE